MGERLIDELNRRGLIAQVSDLKGLSEHLQMGSRTLYSGFDPTADSLHIGHLVPLLTLRRFKLHGHRPIVLVGGATGLIGDPSWRDDERNLNSTDVVGQWVGRIRGQVEQFVDFSGKNAALVTNNLDWTANLNVISFLRDVGKYFSVNAMIQRDSVRSRLDRDDQGISYTEFSYMLLQAMDYVELAERYGCTLQIGGSDQWGNIVSGMDLVRRKLQQEAYALTLPLITKSDGGKFGKTAAGAIWLDPQRTSPYSFYQFWLNAADAYVVHFLNVFTFVGVDEIEEIASASAAAPEQREAQRRLAEEVTALVHGADAVASSQRISDCLFKGDVRGLSAIDLEQLLQDGMATTLVDAPQVGLVSVLADSGLAPSRGAARKLVQGKGVQLNGVVQDDVERHLDWQDALYGRFYLLRRGKKNWHLIARQDPN